MLSPIHPTPFFRILSPPARSEFDKWAFRFITDNPLPTNPLKVVIETRTLEIFKAGNPVRNSPDKWETILYKTAVTRLDFKDSERNKSGKKISDIFFKVQRIL
jgi:hypothetical protein